MVANTADFFLGQPVELRQQHDRFLAVAFQKCVGIVVPTNTLTVHEGEILVNLAEVVEHTHNVGRTLVLPMEIVVLCELDKELHDRSGVLVQTSFMCAVVLRGSRYLEEAPVHQPVQHINREKRCAIGELHQIAEIGQLRLREAISHS